MSDGNAEPFAAPAIERLTTQRLLLLRMRAEDLDDLVRMHHNPQVMATLGGVQSPEETGRFLDGMLAHWEQRGFGCWTLHNLGSGRFAGRGGPRHVTVDGQDEVEVGYAFLPEFWGHGLATELARESVRVAFKLLCLSDLVCFTLPTNRASRRVMEKAGFHYERDITYANLPHVLYRLTRDEYESGAKNSNGGLEQS